MANILIEQLGRNVGLTEEQIQSVVRVLPIGDDTEYKFEHRNHVVTGAFLDANASLYPLWMQYIDQPEGEISVGIVFDRAKELMAVAMLTFVEADKSEDNLNSFLPTVKEHLDKLGNAVWFHTIQYSDTRVEDCVRNNAMIAIGIDEAVKPIAKWFDRYSQPGKLVFKPPEIKEVDPNWKNWYKEDPREET